MESQTTQNTRPKPGLGLLVLKDDNKILLGKRKDCGLYGIPGGYLERFESWEEGAARELKEEVDLTIDPQNIHIVQVFNAVDKSQNYHNVAIVMVCRYPDGQEVKTMEPEKCEGWEWWNIEDMEKRIEEIFWPNRQLVIEYKDRISKESLKSILENPPKFKSCFFNKQFQ